jgi:hypothetical protein
VHVVLRGKYGRAEGPSLIESKKNDADGGSGGEGKKRLEA